MNKLLMVHVPRTGGTSFNHFFANKKNEIHFQNIGHKKLEAKRSAEMISWFKFAIVRNPWSWVASHYLTINYSLDFYITRNNRPATNAAVKPFKDFILWLFSKKKNQSYYITDNEKITVDYVGRFENLENEFNFICKEMKIEDGVIPLKHSEGSDRRPFKDKYKEIYDQETIDLVSEVWKEDIERFNYKY